MRPSCRFQPVVVLRSWFRSRSQCGTGRLGLLRMRRPITRRRFEAARVSLDTALHWEPQISYAGRSMDMIEFETKLRQSFSEGKDSITITFARDAFKGCNHAKTSSAVAGSRGSSLNGRLQIRVIFSSDKNLSEFQL